MIRLSYALVAILGSPLLVATASAQVVFDPNVGTGLSLGDDAMSRGNALGFGFAFPNGATVTAIDIDSNGRILPPGSRLSDPTASIGELLANGTSICPLWSDLDPSAAAADDVYFHAYNNGSHLVAVITWKDVVEAGQTTPFTVQVVLRDDNSFSMWWSATAPAGSSLVGMSAGANGADPGVSNLNCGPLLSTSGEPTLYETFAAGSFDLAGNGINWLPFGGGVYAVSTPFVGTCVPPVPPTQARMTGVGCGGVSTPRAVDYVPDGSGGYHVLESTNVFDPNVGSSIGIVTDEGIAVAPLGFSFTMPSGT
ncbi:MAG: hypothetical protein KDB80_16835, partial [Planctomycetes bacterium]|nr:hypothetical protein [Planctomycetota bacterium]